MTDTKTYFFHFILISISILVIFSGISFHSLWFDEALTANICSQPDLNTMIETIKIQESIPPLFFIIEKMMTNALGNSEFALRLFPAFCGIFIGLMGMLIFNYLSRSHLIGFLIGLTLSISGTGLYYAVDARPYSFFVLTALCLVFIVVKWLRTGKKIYVLTLFTLSFLIVQIHYYSVIWIGSMVISLFMLLPKNTKNYKILAGIIFLSLLSFISLWPFFSHQLLLQIGGEKDYLTKKFLLGIPYSAIKILLGPGLRKIHSFSDFGIIDSIFCIICLCLYVIVSINIYHRLKCNELSIEEKFTLLAFIIAYTVHIILGWKIPTVHPRYMVYFLILQFGFILVYISKTIKIKGIVLFVLAFMNLWGIVFRFYSKDLWYVRPWREVALFIEKNNCNNIIAGGYSLKGLSYYLTTNKKLYTAPKNSLFDLHTPVIKKEIKLNNKSVTEFVKPKLKHNSATSTLHEVMLELHQGILVMTEQNQPLKLMGLSNTNFPITFTLMQKYKTNQGSIYVIFWEDYTDSK